MSAEREFRNELRVLTAQDFLDRYLSLKEVNWVEMTRGVTQAWEDELVFRGLSGKVLEATGEMVTPGKRYLTMHYHQTLQSDPRSRQYKGLANVLPTAETGSVSLTTATPSLKSPSEKTAVASEPSMDNPLLSATIASGDSFSATEVVPGVGPDNRIVPPSSEESSGAPIGAANGFEMVAYQRLPLAGKRDAFLADGFLYVRQETLVGWLRRLQAGRCCPLARKGQGHSSDCWLGRALG